MPELEIIMGGYSINTDQTRLGLCTVTLIRGEVLSIVDVAHFGRRNLLVDALAAHGISTDDIGRVILTHALAIHEPQLEVFIDAIDKITAAARDLIWLYLHVQDTIALDGGSEGREFG